MRDTVEIRIGVIAIDLELNTFGIKHANRRQKTIGRGMNIALRI